jgi:cleavage stimulation factor subunit 3
MHVPYREKMAQAYDFALEKIGMDIQSYSIWNDYVNFLKAVEAVGSYAENQKISAVRKVSVKLYHGFYIYIDIWTKKG